MITATKKKENADVGLEIYSYSVSKNDRAFTRGRTGFKHYEKSYFLSGSDISDKSFYSRGN